jgi:hypothetical protein
MSRYLPEELLVLVVLNSLLCNEDCKEMFGTIVGVSKRLKDIAYSSMRHVDLTFDKRIVDTRPFASLRNLATLKLGGCTQVSDVSSLGALTNLQELNIERTHVSDVSSLGAMTKLQRLHLKGTQVSDMSPLGALTNLQELNISVIDVNLDHLANPTWKN